MGSEFLAVVGSANADLVFEAFELPAPGETVLAKSFRTYFGGKGANQAVAAARLGADVHFIGKVGNDEFGRGIKANLEQNGVETSHLYTAETSPTGAAGVIVGGGGENMIVVNSGANAHLYAEEVEIALDKLQPALVATQLEIQTAAVEACSGRGRLLLNPAPARAIPEPLLRSTWLLTPNRAEAQRLTGIQIVDEASCALCGRRLLDMGVQSVVITLGKEGAFVCSRNIFQLLPTLNVRSVDSTGAGDAFCGALSAFLLEGRSLFEAVVLANAAAALSTTRLGAQEGMPTRAELSEQVPGLV